MDWYVHPITTMKELCTDTVKVQEERRSTSLLDHLFICLSAPCFTFIPLHLRQRHYNRLLAYVFPNLLIYMLVSRAPLVKNNCFLCMGSGCFIRMTISIFLFFFRFFWGLLGFDAPLSLVFVFSPLLCFLSLSIDRIRLKYQSCML